LSIGGAFFENHHNGGWKRNPFLSEQALIQETVNRFRNFLLSSRLFIALPRHYLPLLKNQLPDFPLNQLIVEPQQKDTAACIALSIFRFFQAGDDEPVAFVHTTKARSVCWMRPKISCLWMIGKESLSGLVSLSSLRLQTACSSALNPRSRG